MSQNQTTKIKVPAIIRTEKTFHSVIFYLIGVPTALRMKSRFVAHTSGLNEIWPLWTCPGPTPFPQGLAHHSPVPPACLQSLQCAEVLPAAAISDSWCLGRNTRRQKRRHQRAFFHSSAVTQLLLVLQAWFQCLLLKKAFQVPIQGRLTPPTLSVSGPECGAFYLSGDPRVIYYSLFACHQVGLLEYNFYEGRDCAQSQA